MKNIAASVRERLLNISKKYGVDYQIILTRYFHERFLFRLATSPYRDNFCLKGGTLLFAYEKFMARPTLDMDFCADKISNSQQSIHDAVVEICLIECDEDGVVFDANSITTEAITEFREYHGIRVHLAAHLDSVRQRIAIDFGFGDTIFPAAQSLPFPNILEDIPMAPLSTYPLESVIAEKFQCILDLAEDNTRMKDFFDIYKILTNHTINEKNLAEAIQRTFRNRKTIVRSNGILFSGDFGSNETMNQMWETFLKKIKCSDHLEFKDVWNFIRDKLSRYITAV
jgi:predicted nucleotidyltransferase component of viral defense system